MTSDKASSGPAKRRYTQRRRAESAAETRRRIMDAARALLLEKPLRHLNLDEVARRAGVSRSTIHLIYRSRSEFFVAMAKDTFERAGFDRVLAAFENADARRAFTESHASLMRFYATDFPIHNAFIALAALDPDVAEAVRPLRQLRIEHSEYIARRLRDEGYIAADFDLQEAADIVWLMVSFETFSDLYVNRKMTPPQIARRLMAIAERSLGMQRS